MADLEGIAVRIVEIGSEYGVIDRCIDANRGIESKTGLDTEERGRTKSRVIADTRKRGGGGTNIPFDSSIPSVINLETRSLHSKDPEKKSRGSHRKRRRRR